MKTLSVATREFREQLATYLDAQNPVAITRHGETIGYYIPVHAKQTAADALNRLGSQIDALLQNMGRTEDEMLADFKAARRAPK